MIELGAKKRARSNSLDQTRSRILPGLSARILPYVTKDTFSAKCSMWAAMIRFRLDIKEAREHIK